MGIIEIIVAIAVLLIVLWVLNAYAVPNLPKPLGAILMVVVVLIAALMLLARVGLIPAGALR